MPDISSLSLYGEGFPDSGSIVELSSVWAVVSAGCQFSWILNPD